MNLVYRVQDADGRGPWKPGFSRQWSEGRDGAEAESLAPIADIPAAMRALAKSRPWVGCGCVDAATLRRWFTPGEYAALLRFGYASVTLPIDRILWRGSTQVLFHSRSPLNAHATAFRLYDPETPR